MYLINIIFTDTKSKLVHVLLTVRELLNNAIAKTRESIFVIKNESNVYPIIIICP